MSVTITVQSEEAEVRLRAAGQDALGRVREAMDRAMATLQAHVKADKLSGQVLKNRTGTLRRSINRRVEVRGLTVEGLVGTNVEYARRHEYGFDGTENVRSFTRLQTHVFGRELAEPFEVVVQAFTRHARTLERPFLRPALADLRNEILTELGRAVAEGR